jgi:hypothetical protein
VRTLNRSLERAERGREGLRFTPTNADAVKAAKAKADAATATKEAECKKRGDKCRDREADERKALEDLETVTKEKSVTDRARELETEIADLKTKIEKAGPVLDANPQGSAFARVLNLPEAEASRLTAKQNLAMVIMIEILIVASLIAFEVLSRDAEPKPVIETARKPDEAPSVVEEPRAFPGRPKPRLIASRPDPFGSVMTIMADLLEPGRGKVEFVDAYKAYARVCHQQGRRPVSPEEFGTALKRLCEGLDINVKTEGDLLYLLKVRLKSVSKAAAKAETEA